VNGWISRAGGRFDRRSADWFHDRPAALSRHATPRPRPRLLLLLLLLLLVEIKRPSCQMSSATPHAHAAPTH